MITPKTIFGYDRKDIDWQIGKKKKKADTIFITPLERFEIPVNKKGAVLCNTVIVSGDYRDKPGITELSWYKEIKDQCETHGVKYLFYGYGRWVPEAVCGFQFGPSTEGYEEDSKFYLDPHIMNCYCSTLHIGNRTLCCLYSGNGYRDAIQRLVKAVTDKNHSNDYDSVLKAVQKSEFYYLGDNPKLALDEFCTKYEVDTIELDYIRGIIEAGFEKDQQITEIYNYETE